MAKLSDIISSEIVRKQFKKVFLDNHPPSYHPLDIERLDHFICLASSYCRKKINLDDLRSFLATQKGWEESDINWYITRIKSGLEIIRVYKKRDWT